MCRRDRLKRIGGINPHLEELLAVQTFGKFFWDRDLRPLTQDEERLRTEYHRLFYDLWKRGHGTIDTSWMGWRIVKSPQDLWVYQEIIAELRPTVLIETGTRFGGSAIFFASLFDLVGDGRVISVDIDRLDNFPDHDRITYITGMSCEPEVVDQVTGLLQDKDRVMVILDSDHSYANVLSELDNYAPLVTPGQYLVCEDTNLNGNPVREDFGPGPAEALAEFMTGREDFEADPTRERFLFTVAPGGFLKRK